MAISWYLEPSLFGVLSWGSICHFLRSRHVSLFPRVSVFNHSQRDTVLRRLLVLIIFPQVRTKEIIVVCLDN